MALPAEPRNDALARLMRRASHLMLDRDQDERRAEQYGDVPEQTERSTT